MHVKTKYIHRNTSKDQLHWNNTSAVCSHIKHGMATRLLHPPNSTEELRTAVALRWWFQHFQEPLVWLGNVGLEEMKVCLMVISYGFMWSVLFFQHMCQ